MNLNQRHSRSVWAVLPEALSLLLLALYLLFFIQSLSTRWFSPDFTNEDAFQQWYPLHEVLTPGRHSQDLIYQAMSGYLMPIHWGIAAFITILTRDPVMSSHWVMLLQFLLTGLFVWLSVRRLSSRTVAHLSLLWLLHSRPLLERLAGGLPRGWMAPLCAAMVWCLIGRRFRGALLVVFCAAFSSPTAAAVCVVALHLWLFFRLFSESGSPVLRRQMAVSLVACLLIAASAWFFVRQPETIGQMVSLSQAQKMPEFQRGSGRFKFLPFRPAWEEFQRGASKVFASPGQAPVKMIGVYSVWWVLGAMLGMSFLVRRHVAWLWNPEALSLAVAALLVYFAARILAFQLYVPNRYLMLPFAVFFLIALPAGLWKFSQGRRDLGALVLAVFSLFIWLGSGNGLKGHAGLAGRRPSPDYTRALAKLLPGDALIAGNPEGFPTIPLFANRRLYVSSEVAHPFFSAYYGEMRRRLRISWDSVYARDINSFLRTLRKEGVTHFLFRHSDYKPEALKSVKTFQPFGNYVGRRTGFPPEDYLFSRLMAGQNRDFVVYEDKKVVLVDLSRMDGIL